MPFIGITADWNDEKKCSTLPNDYVRAVLAAGGVPLILPIGGEEKVWKSMVDKLDGMLFTGGVDMDPKYFGEEMHPKTNTPIPQRDEQELYMMRYALKQGKPLLAICRGFQMLNCLDLGTLYQDIGDMVDTPIDHAQFTKKDALIHQVSLVPDTLLARVCGAAPLQVNSRHHQAVKQVGKGLVASAHAPDGLVEALEFEKEAPCLAVQWHPESLFDKDERAMLLFTWLVREAEQRA